MKKNQSVDYKEPVLEVMLFEIDDIITSSSDNPIELPEDDLSTIGGC